MLAGRGSVDLDGIIATADTAALLSSSITTIPGTTTQSGVPANQLTITNRGTIQATRSTNGTFFGGAVSLLNGDTFVNNGTIALVDRNSYAASAIFNAKDVTNSGTITLDGGTGISYAGTVTNSGRIVQVAGGASAAGIAQTSALTNSGTISVQGTAVQLTSSSYLTPATLINSGTIIGGTAVVATVPVAIINAAGGVLSGGNGTAMQVDGGSFTNAGSVVGTVDFAYTGYGGRSYEPATYTAAGGTITGDLLFGNGADTFLRNAASSGVSGIIDGGAGVDRLIVDAGAGGAVSGTQFVDFERVIQAGSGTVAYSGTFTAPTIELTGGGLTVAAGTMLATAGATTITGGSAGVGIVNAGTIAGGIVLGAGDDSVVNSGRIGGNVTLGAGNDSFTEGPGSSVGGTVDGGAGVNTYRVLLAGDRSSIAARTNFGRLAVEGNGTLTFALDRDYTAIALNGAGLNLALNGRVVAQVTGGDSADRLTVDGDLPSVALGGGDDLLALGTTRAAGRYDGGAGSDTLRFTAAGPVTLAGTATGFETVSLAGGSLTVTGTLGSAGAPLALRQATRT